MKSAHLQFSGMGFALIRLLKISLLLYVRITTINFSRNRFQLYSRRVVHAFRCGLMNVIRALVQYITHQTARFVGFSQRIMSFHLRI